MSAQGASSGKVQLTVIDDFKGQNVAIVGLKAFSQVLANFNPAEIQRDIGIIVEANLADIVIAARGKARKKTGFMAQSTDYAMLGPMAGNAYSAAPYAYRQEKGFTTPTGGKVSANNFFIPSAATGMRQFISDMNLYLKGLITGAPSAPRPIRQIPRGAVVRRAPVTRGMGTHKYIKKIAVGGGKYRYVYATGTTGTQSRFTKVLKPGLGKANLQVARRRRIV